MSLFLSLCNSPHLVWQLSFVRTIKPAFLLSCCSDVARVWLWSVWSQMAHLRGIEKDGKGRRGAGSTVLCNFLPRSSTYHVLLHLRDQT